jgi:peroxiredoxin Q/BCP
MIRLSPSLKPGDPAPDFRLQDGQGKWWSLKDFAGRFLVLYFYPADFTSGCTAESCGFRDGYADFKGAGAEVAGVSGDSPARHAAFKDELGLPFPLLSDPDRAARRAYTVPQVLGRMSGRTTFVIGPDGVIRYVFDSRSDAPGHVTRALEFLRHAH